MSLGSSLFRARKNKGLSQEAAAEKLRTVIRHPVRRKDA